MIGILYYVDFLYKYDQSYPYLDQDPAIISYEGWNDPHEHLQFSKT
jgi:hypothetical protein